MKKISVIMSVYNEDVHILKEAINSILQQDYSNFEFIIINDNPTNAKISDVLIQYAKEESKIKLYFNRKNEGLVYSLNYALKHATGEYVARMDADDISLKCRLSKQIGYLSNNNLDLIGSFISLIDDSGSIINDIVKFPFEPDDVENNLIRHNVIVHPTFFAKRSVFTLLEGYRAIPYSEDYDFLLRACIRKLKLGNCPEVLLHYRIRETGISKSHHLEQQLASYYLKSHYESIETLNIKSLNDFVSKKLKHSNGWSFKQGIKYHTIYNAQKNLNNNSFINIFNLVKLFVIGNSYFNIIIYPQIKHLAYCMIFKNQKAR